jgi:hypothetical protein
MELSLKDLREMIGGDVPKIDNKMIGKYVLVRCQDAGVHCGVLEAYNGRECVLTEVRRLWYWKPKNGAFLSSVAERGLDSSSKIGEPQSRIHLTENCEIAQCSLIAEESIRGQSNYNK